MTKPTVSLPFPKRWPLSTIFIPENMHTTFIPYSCRHPFNSRLICGNSWRVIVPHPSPLSYRIRHHYHTTFVNAIIPPSSPFSYHLRSTKIFQPPINQPIPKFPSFPSFPNFPRFPRIPAFPRNPRHPQPRSARRSEQHESLDRAVCDQQTSVNFLARQPRQWQQKIDKGIA